MLKKFLVERNVDSVGELLSEKFFDFAEKSNKAIDQLGPGIQWNESYVTGNKLYCVYISESEDLIREHSRIAGLPVASINEVKRMIDPTSTKIEEFPVPDVEDIYDSIL